MLNRRNNFQSGKTPEPPPKLGRSAPVRVTPSVSRETAEIAAHLHLNPVFVDLIASLRAAAVQRFGNSKLGDAGATERDAARYELEALSTIERQLGAIAAETQLYEPAEDLSGD